MAPGRSGEIVRPKRDSALYHPAARRRAWGGFPGRRTVPIATDRNAARAPHVHVSGMFACLRLSGATANVAR